MISPHIDEGHHEGSCCTPENGGADPDGHDHSAGISKFQLGWVGLSGVAIAGGFLFRWVMPESFWVSTAFFAASTLAGSVLVLPHAWGALRKGRLEMNVLMAVAVIGAWLIGEGAEGAAVVFLFAFAELLESWSVGRARRAIKSLLALTPETAWRKSISGDAVEVAVSEVQVNDVILVRSGQRVPLDGEVSSGQSAINQAPITGRICSSRKRAWRSGFCRNNQWGRFAGGPR